MHYIRRRLTTTIIARHDNPLGLPHKNGSPSPPQIPRRGGLPSKRPVAHVDKVLAVASGKGGVGKSTIAVNLAFSLSHIQFPDRPRLRVGILDLDIFGPSIPTLMGLTAAPEPELTSIGALRPLVNHNLPSMSMGYLIPKPVGPDSASSPPVIWRGLMVQKAVQQLLFDVDWSSAPGSNNPDESAKNPGLDVLVIDMPPGTGDVPLTLGQLLKVDGAVIVSTPQDVALSDVKKGISMFQKLSIPITGLILNQSHFLCPSCNTSHTLFGSPSSFRTTASKLGIPILAELPLVPGVSAGGDAGIPYSLLPLTKRQSQDGHGGQEWNDRMMNAADFVWQSLSQC